MKTTNYLEHVNLESRNLDDTIQFIQLALPEFKVRGGGKRGGIRWTHIGTEETYLALVEKGSHFTGKPNHIGFAVQDIDSIAERLIGAGYKRSYPREVESFRIREYFLDASGQEFEFVQYLSDNDAERNLYE